MIFRGKPENANRQAADWLARLHADDPKGEDKFAFRAWLNADASHQDAFERASAVWDAVGGLRGHPPEQAQAAEPARLSRRVVIAGGGALIVAGGLTLGWQEAHAGVYRTEIGEQRRLVLDDGTRVMLDTDTRIRFRAGDDLRTLSLAGGRIDLDIAADPRPFVIEAGGRRVTAQAARLDVRRDGDRVALTAVQGSARVEVPGAAASLASGSRIAMAAGRPDRIDRPELEDLIAWQSGRLAFRDETIAQAITEMNRYTTRSLIVSDARVGAMRLSGVYRVGDPEAFARSLAVLLPVRVTSDGDEIRISAAD